MRQQEIKAIRDVLEEMKKAIQKELKHKPEQFELFTPDEKDQLRADKAVLQRKLDAIPDMQKEEVAAISRRYDSPVESTFPVAVAFVVPESWRGGEA